MATNHEATGKIILDKVELTLKRLLLDVAHFIEENPLPAEEETTKVLLPAELKNAPLELRFAGGWVRDKLLGTKSHDIDVAINKMTGEQFGDRLQEYLDTPGNADKYGLGGLKKKAGSLTKIEKNPEASKNLETVTTKILGIDLDLVNLRKETYTEDSRNPQVEFGTPEEDALRRDATINALFYNISTGELEDFTGRGLDDMRGKIIRTPLEPYTTFKDDPLRVLRLIRFASRLGYEVDAETKKFMGNEEIRRFFLAKITKERVWIELEKMLKGPDPCKALSLIDELDLYRTVFMDPSRPDLFKADTTSWRETFGLWNTMLAAEAEPAATITSTLITNKDDLFLSWFLVSMVPWADAPAVEPLKTGKIPPPLATKMALAAFKAPNQVTNVLTAAVNHLSEIREMKDSKETKRDVLGMAVRKWGATWRLQVLFAMFYEVFADPTRTDTIKQYAAFIQQISTHGLLEAHTFKPLLDGTALAKALNTKPGPWMKAGLDIVMAWQLRHPEITDPQAAIEEVRISDVMSTPAPATTKISQKGGGIAEANGEGHVKKKQKKGELTSNLVAHFLRKLLKPLFDMQGVNPDLTPMGRRKFQPHKPEPGDVEFGDEKKPWKRDLYALDLLLWCCQSVDAKTLEREWGFIVPPLLGVLDDTDVRIRARGCEMLEEVLRNCPPDLLKRTGLAPVFQESLFTSVSYLPSLTPVDESVVLLDVAVPTLLSLAEKAHPRFEPYVHDPARQKTLDTLLRKAFLAPYVHAGEHIRIAEVLVTHLTPLLNAHGLDVIKHLPSLIPLLSHILSNPLAATYPTLLLPALAALQAVISNAWPRILEWKSEILAGVCVCWIRLLEEGQGEVGEVMLEKIEGMLRDVVEMLGVVVRKMGVLELWEEEVGRIVEADGRLGVLFGEGVELVR